MRNPKNKKPARIKKKPIQYPKRKTINMGMVKKCTK